MQFETLLLENTGHLATLTLNRPEKRNAITTQMIARLYGIYIPTRTLLI